MRQSFCYDKMYIFHSEAVTHSAFAIYLPSKQMLSDQINSHSFGAPLVNDSGTDRFKAVLRLWILFVVNASCLFVFVMLSCLLPAALLSPAGKWLLCVVFSCVVRCGTFN